jgi:hypothetical protein
MPWVIYCSYERDDRINFREGSFDWILKVRAHFLIVKRDPRAASPHPSDENYEIDIFLIIVQRSDKKNSGVNRTPQDTREGVLSYALRACMVLMKGMLV